MFFTNLLIQETVRLGLTFPLTSGAMGTKLYLYVNVDVDTYLCVSVEGFRTGLPKICHVGT